MVVGLCNGASGVAPGDESLARLGEVLQAALLSLAVSIVADGEGSTRTMRLDVTGARDGGEAEAVARAVANSPLVKTAFYGRDANWGRIMQAIGQALGRDGRQALPARIAYEDVVIVEHGQPAALDSVQQGRLAAVMQQPEIALSVALNGPGAASDRLLQRPHARLRHPQRGVLHMTVRHQKTVKTLLEAMPYIRRFWGTTVVLKYGGAAMTSPRLQEQFAEDVVLLRLVGMKPVVVHGGGPQISTHMKRLGMEPKFVDGQRVTDEATMEVAKMVLVGKVNKEIVGLINRHGGTAVGISGEDGRLLQVAPKQHRDVAGNEVDLGFVGEVDRGQRRRPRPAGRGQHPGRRQRRRRRLGRGVQRQRRHGRRRAGGGARRREDHLPHRRRGHLRGAGRRDRRRSPSATSPTSARWWPPAASPAACSPRRRPCAGRWRPA